MKRNLALLSFIFLYSCGGNKSSITQPPIIDYYIDDQTFIDELNDLNVSASENEIIAGITTVDFIDVDTGTLYYKIKKLDLSSMKLDSIPNSITQLDSLINLNLRDNKIENLDPDIFCGLSGLIEGGITIDVEQNLLCNSLVPTCIINLESSLTAFFNTQKECIHQMAVDDRDFIHDMITSNWDISENDSQYDSLWSVLNNENNTIWHEFTEPNEITGENHVVSRIIQIKYEGFNNAGQKLDSIPWTINKVDSLKFVYLSNNNLVTVPAEIGDLQRLEILRLDGNQITTIPASIGGGVGLKKLRELVINNNALTNVSTNLSNLTSLTELDLSRNNLVTLPASLCDLVSKITIRYNKFCPACTAECPECSSVYNSCFNSLIMEQTPNADQNCDTCGE